MTTRITRPTLAELWRVVLARLEREGIEDAPALARSMAVAALTGRVAEARGLRVKRRGADVAISLAEGRLAPGDRRGLRGRKRSRMRDLTNR